MKKLSKNQKYLIYALIGSAVIGGFYFTLNQTFKNDTISVENSQNTQIVKDSQNVQQTIIENQYINSTFGPVTINVLTTNPLLKRGIFGNTYYNEDLDFKISRPNEKWYFNEKVNELKTERTGTPLDPFFLGGIDVATPAKRDFSFLHDIGVTVVVYDDDRLKIDSIEEHVEQLAKIGINRYDGILTQNYTSPNKDWAILSFEFLQPEALYVADQIIEIRDDKLYVIQYVGPHPDYLSEEFNDEIRFVFNSIEIFSNKS